MSYEDFSEVIYLPSVIKGGQGSIQKVKTTPKSDVGLFAAPLGYYSDTVAASGDQLPWGVASVWANGESNANGVPVDWTGEADAIISSNFSYLNTGTSLITAEGEYNNVDSGISKILLDDPSDTANAKVDKFAIVIDSGVALLDDFNIGEISESLSMSFIDSNYNTLLSDETFTKDSKTWNKAFKDTVGHGTHVAGTIAAKADGKGVVGVAPGAEVISLKVFGDTGSTTFEIIFDAVKTAIDYVLEDSVDLWGDTGEIKYLGIQEKDTSALNIDNTVINLSLGGGLNAQSQPIVDLIESAAAQGVKFAIAGGNSNADVDYTSPAAAGAVDNVYTVSAVDKKYVMASFTNYDDDDDGGVDDDVDVAGPGVDVLSYTGEDGTIQAWSGTSMAAPAVAGLLLMTPQDGEGPKKTVDGQQVSDAADGIQEGEDVFPNYTTFTDPYALSTLYGGIEPYQDGFNDDDQPDDAPEGDDDWEEGDDTDNNEYNNDSPWNGYNPDNYYFETVGNIKGQLGTYSMSTGPSSVDQAILEEDLGIIAGDLDKAMTSYVESESSSFFTGYTDSITKNAINATEGSGIKFTGYGYAGDTLVFDYLIASNDYIPYNDFAFVQLKTGDALGNWDGQTELQSLGSIGLDVDDFGTKKGTFSYTLTAEDFNYSSYGVTTTIADANGDDAIDFYDLTLDVNEDGLNDVKDKIVLNLDGAGIISEDDYILDANGDGEISSADLSSGGELTFGGDASESIAILKGSASEAYVLDYLTSNDPTYEASYNYATYEGSISGPDSNSLAAYLGLGYSDFQFAFEGDEETNEDGTPKYQGFFDLSAGVTDAIDGWVDTTLMIKGMGLIPAGQDENLINEEDDDIWVDGTLNWSEDLKLGNGTVTSGSAGDVATMSTGAGSVGQGVLEAVIGLEDGVLDTDLNGTKYAIDATSGSGVYATSYAQVGDVISFDYSFETNDYAPYKDFSWFSVNDTVEKIVALGEDVENFGKAKGTITYTLTEDDFDANYIAPFTDGESNPNAGGKLTLGFGVMDALDTCVDSYLDISNVFIYNPENVDEIPEEKKEATADEIINDFDEFEESVYGNASLTFEGDELTVLTLSTEYVYDGTAYTGDPTEEIGSSTTLSASDIEWYTGLESGILSTSLNGTKDSINATTGSAISLSGVGAVGDTFSFNFEFASNDYNPFEDFAYVSVNEEAYVLENLDQSSSTYGQTAVVTNLSNNIGASDFSGSFAYTLTKADLGGSNFGEFILSAGVMNALDNAVATTLTLSDFNYDPGDYLQTDETTGEYLEELEEIFEDDYSAYFETIGDVYVESDAYGGFSLSTAGNVASDSELESFAALANKTLDKSMTINDGWTNKSFNGLSKKGNINATEGSAVQLISQANVGDTAYFYYYFETNDYTPYADFSWYSVGDTAYMIAGVGTNVENWGSKEGFIEYEIKDGDLDEYGQFEITLGVVDALDGAVESSLDIWGFGIAGSDEQTPDYEAPDGIDNDDYGDFDDEYFEYNDDFYFEAGSYFDVNGDGYLTDADMILDYNTDGVINYLDMLIQGNDSFGYDNELTEGDLVQGDGGTGTVKFESVASNNGEVSYNFNEITSTAEDKGFFVTLDNQDEIFVYEDDGSYYDDLNWETEIYDMYFDFLTEENSAYVFSSTDEAASIVLEGTSYGFISLGDEDFFEDTDGDGYEDGYWDDYDPNEDSYYSDLIPDEDQDVYEEIDIEMLGNTFQIGNSVVMSTGGGAIDQYDIENALGLKDGALDEAFAIYDSSGNVIEVTKEAIDATQGSAAYDTVEVKVGDVINFGFTFGTDDYIPYQDFAFFALNGQAHSIATVGVEVDSYGEYSDVYNYVISADDLGGEDSGVVTIGVGIMDAIDYCVDSYIEVYDFQVSGDEKYDDATNDGIVDGESAYSINTAVGLSSYDASTSNTIKLSFKGKSVSAETSDLYDVVASASSDVVSGGYQVLLEGTGKKDGKWFVHQTDAYGAIINNKKSGWKTEAKAIDLGWEQIFNFDINGDAVLEGTSDSDNLMLYSAKQGGITISNFITEYDESTGQATTDTSTVAQGDINIIATTASKADFTTFSTSGETLQSLVAGTGANSGKYQVWTFLAETGFVIDKSGYTEWTQDDATGEWDKNENDWYTAAQAIAVGLEDDFATDIDNNGILSGGSSYKILGPDGGLVIKNTKGIALDNVTAPYYSPLGAVKTKQGYDLALEGATGSEYEGLYSIWKTNDFGKVTTEAAWITKDQFVAGKYEEYFNVDANSDGLIGVSKLLDETDTSNTKLAVGDKNKSTAVQTEESGVIVSTILKDQKGKKLKLKMGAFTMLDAETVTGLDDQGNEVDLNQVVFTAKNNKTIQIYNYDDDWSYESKSKIKAKTDEFYQAEINFNADLNNDGIIATKVGDEYFAEGLVASEDDLTDMYKNDANEILFTYGQTDEEGNAVLDSNGEQVFDKFTFQDNKGKTVKAKQGKYEVTDVLGTEDLELKVAFNSGKAIKVYTLADPEAVDGVPIDPEKIKIQSIETIKSNKVTFFEQEIAFDYDFNDDGIVGNLAKAAASAAVGEFTAQYDYLGKAFYETDVDGVATSFELQSKKGKQLKKTIGKDELSGVGEIGDDNTFTAVYKNSKTDMLSIYEMTDVLDSEGAATGNKKQVGKTKKIKTKALSDYLGYETDFGIDFNGDGYVGKDIGGATDADGNKIGDGTFNDDDLILGENKGQVDQYTDLEGVIYAKGVNDSDSTALTIDNAAFVDKAYKKLKGWSVLGLDTTFTEDGLVNNVGVFKKGKNYKMISFGSDWNFDTSKDSSDSIINYNAKKLLSNNIEDLFVQDLNNDGF